MKTVLPFTFVAVLLLSAAEPVQAARAPAPTQAQAQSPTQRWCLRGDENTTCTFDTLKQCQASRTGGHGTCFRARRPGAGR
jgi:hypothetical protein